MLNSDLFVTDMTGKILGRASWWLSLKSAECRADYVYATPCGSGRWDYVEQRHADAMKARGMDVRLVSVSGAS